MNASKVNKAIIKYLQSLTDDNSITINQHKHIKLEGIYGGTKRSLTLSSSPSSLYQRYTRSTLRRFLRTLDIETPPELPI